MVFATEFERDKQENARERVQIVPLIHKAPGSDYPPNLVIQHKGKDHVAKGSRRKIKRKTIRLDPEGVMEEAGIPKRPLEFTEEPNQGVAIPNHTFLNKSMLRNMNELTAMHYMKVIYPTSNCHTLKAMDNDTFTRELDQDMSKVLPFLAQSFARARLEYQVPQLVGELREAEERGSQAEGERDATIAEGRERLKEIKKLQDQYRVELEITKNHETKPIKGARQAGIEEGQKGFLRSLEGLLMEDRIRKKEGKPKEVFPMKETVVKAPNAHRLQMSAHDKDAKVLLYFFEAEDAGASSTSDSLDDIIEKVAQIGVKIPEVTSAEPPHLLIEPVEESSVLLNPPT